METTIQKSAISETRVNKTTEDVLLDIILDRMEEDLMIAIERMRDCSEKDSLWHEMKEEAAKLTDDLFIAQKNRETFKQLLIQRAKNEYGLDVKEITFERSVIYDSEEDCLAGVNGSVMYIDSLNDLPMMSPQDMICEIEHLLKDGYIVRVKGEDLTLRSLEDIDKIFKPQFPELQRVAFADL
ncbi:hypothetical protein G6R40_01195 [Chryseobacterium sp. POL2]|uniref:hypothetical protein n=1 Tax=Chryseobacterium sp. POL2 TaxID=2713414 RepID=UPI0013E11F50|nr:hypothetical protein [Chryseobacterium sp. POL2]QIG88354.1 hypothetical protein G6R40_01195 [Chryseobacterium sp. POL2]